MTEQIWVPHFKNGEFCLFVFLMNVVCEKTREMLSEEDNHTQYISRQDLFVVLQSTLIPFPIGNSYFHCTWLSFCDRWKVIATVGTINYTIFNTVDSN